jgi:hypothetical protein
MSSKEARVSRPCPWDCRTPRARPAAARQPWRSAECVDARILFSGASDGGLIISEVTQAAIDVWGPDRGGVRLTPSGTYSSMHDSDPQATFGYVAHKFDELGIAYPVAAKVQLPGARRASLVCDLAAEPGEQPQIRAPEQAQFPSPVRYE